MPVCMVESPTGGWQHILLANWQASVLMSRHDHCDCKFKGRRRQEYDRWLEGWTETINEQTGEPTGMTITLPEWLYSGIVGRGGVLTIHEDYFLLTGGIERWLYRVARKHAGSQEMGWTFTMRQLHEKSGSAARISDFAIDIRKAAEANQIPEYDMVITRNAEGEECVHFLNRTHLAPGHPNKEFQRHPRRRIGAGIFTGRQQQLATADEGTGD
jgi:plasmid replication initiation protein